MKKYLAFLLAAAGMNSACAGQSATPTDKDTRTPEETPENSDTFTTTSGKTVTIEPLIHASLRITFDGKEIEIDPVGNLNQRTTNYADFPKADYIFVTHEHHDHLDKQAIENLTGEKTRLFANPNSVEIIGAGETLRNGDEVTLGEGMTVVAVPAYNTTEGHLQFHPKGRDNGYILTLDGLRIYIAGDTEVIPEMKEIKDIDIAFLPCNQPYTMTPEQFVEAAEIIRPKVVYPYHFGNTDLSSIPEKLKGSGIEVRLRPFD